MKGLKIAVLVAATILSTGSAFSKEKKDCSLYLMEPRITHDQYGSNNGGNGVNNGVVKIKSFIQTDRQLRNQVLILTTAA